jgi:hypothetical protein
VLYTIAVNTPNQRGNFDFVEGCLFAFVFGFFFDEVTKMFLLFCEMTLMVRYKVGVMVVGFWNAYNVCLSFYGLADCSYSCILFSLPVFV